MNLISLQFIFTSHLKAQNKLHLGAICTICADMKLKL